MTAAAAPPVDAILRAAGVPPDGLALSDCSRSHEVTYAAGPGGRWVVKRAGDRSLAAELYAYRLASWHPRLASVVPRALLLDERRQVLVLEAAPADALFPAVSLDPGFPSPALAAGLGRALAELHAATDGLPLVTVAGCGIVHLPDAEPVFTGDSEAAQALARTAASDAALAPALRRVAALLSPSCLVHADVKWDNAILDPADVRLFDWELSGHGDPAWDVGCALADTTSLGVRLRGAGAPLGMTPAGAALLAAYGRLADGFAERVAGFWIARMAHLALECAAAVEDAAHPVVVALLDTARAMAARYDELAGAVDGAGR